VLTVDADNNAVWDYSGCLNYSLIVQLVS